MWSICSKSSRYCLSKTVSARELKFLENFHPPHQVSHVPCHVSCVMCHVSCVRCQMSFLLHRWYYQHWSRDDLSPVCGIFLQSCWASRGRVCYQWGLPRLVNFTFPKLSPPSPYLVGLLTVTASAVPGQPLNSHSKGFFPLEYSL